MSRLEFREPVQAVRPRSALLMVAIATVTLAATGQIREWTLGLATAAIALGTLRHGRVAEWQKNPAVLNAGLLGCLSVGLSLWLRGELALIALAHFVVLTQGLQLLDARPRRSEFLLVALAVFQVIAAANLTDSAFFPFLLVGFTVSVVWTLLVHTVRAEALEAGCPEAAGRVLTQGLRRTTLVACVLSIVLAMLLFPMLPRLRSGGLSLGALGAGSVAGFSDRVEFGDIGRIRLDPTVLLRIETLEGDLPDAQDRYWRGIAFDHFDGRRWAVTPPGHERVPGDAEIGLDLGGRRDGPKLVQRIAREQVDPGVLFASGTPLGVRGHLGRLERDVNGALYAHQTAGKRVDYTLVTRVGIPSDTELGRDRTRLPEKQGTRYLQLPDLDPAISALARRIAGGGSDAARLRAIETHLRRHGRYTDEPPHGGAESPVERFLLDDTAGHCEYFASAMVVLARSLGLPARIVNGFAGGNPNRLGNFVELAQSDAHAWVEIHFERAGWVRYDPTPPDLRLAGADGLRGRRWSDLAGTLELWWFRNVVDFGRGHQARALKQLWLSWQDWRGDARGESTARKPGPDRREARSDGPPLPGLGLGAALCLGLAALIAADLRWRRRRRGPLPSFYTEALGLVARRGLVRGTATTAREFAGRVEAQLSPAAARPFRALTEAYLRERFAGRAAHETKGDLRALRDSLRG